MLEMFPDVFDGDDSSPDPRYSTPKLRGTLYLTLPTRSPYPFRSRPSQPSQDLPEISNTLQLITRPEDATSFISRDDWSRLQLEIASLKSAMCALRLQHEELQAIRAELETMQSSQNPQPTSQPVMQPAHQPIPQPDSQTVQQLTSQQETSPQHETLTPSPPILHPVPEKKRKKKKKPK